MSALAKPVAVARGVSVWLDVQAGVPWSQEPMDVDTYVATHSTEQDAAEHARRINDALSWDWRRS